MLISAFTPAGADLRSVCAAERHSHPSEKLQVRLRRNGGWGGIGLALLDLSNGSNYVLIPPRGFKRLRRSGGWGGIRTLGALLHTRFPSVRIRPLCHPS